MLDLNNIKSFYPENLHKFDKLLLKEYLQYKILQIIFNSKEATSLCFIGGTALRMVYEGIRFSEDLDFDNFGLKEEHFDGLISTVKKSLELEGYEVEFRNVFKGAYRCYLRFPKLLYNLGLSGHEEEKVLIQIDTMSQSFKYKPENVLINKFDVFTKINVAPSDILLSQKICAIFGRKTQKGRDFYDTVFLFSKTNPNFDYLDNKLGVGNIKELKVKLLKLSKHLDFKQLSKDVEPFLFNEEDTKRVAMFYEFIYKLP